MATMAKIVVIVRELWKNKKLMLIGAVLQICIQIFVCYTIYLFLFGWTFKVEQGLTDWIKSKEPIEVTYDNKNYRIELLEEEGTLYVIEYCEDYPEGEKIFYDQYLAIASNFKKLVEAGIVDFSDGDALLLDDSDVERILEKIIQDENEKEKQSEKEYIWISKVYDYGEHEETGVDENGNSVSNMVRNDTPEWMPDDIWDEEDMDRWQLNDDSVTLYANDIKGEKNPDGTDRFLLRWQFVTAILEMSSSQGYPKWNKTGDESKADFSIMGYSDMDGYYLKDSDIQAVIDALSYDFDFWYDGTEHQWSAYDFKDMEKIAYRLEYEEMDPDPSVGTVAYIKKTPETAPNIISNIYERHIYNYEAVPDGYGKYICIGRDVQLDGMAFYNFVVQFVPDFDWDEFIEVLEHFPSSEGAVSTAIQLQSIYDWQSKTGEPYFTMANNEPCISVGVRLGKKLGDRLDNHNPEDWNPGTGQEYLDGNFDYVWVDGGWYAISEGARADLRQSDNLSVHQIRTLLSYFATRYGNPEGADLTDAAEGLYEWQENGGGSITGYLAIWITEGALTTKIGRNHWNFGNYTAYGSEPYFQSSPTNTHKWLDVKSMYGNNISAAVVDQISRTARNYWSKGQSSYYAMCWNTANGTYWAQTPEEADTHAGFTHCYCPYWEDNSFMVTLEQTPNPAYRGWANNCAMYRNQLLSLI